MTVSLRCDHAFFLEKLAIIKCCLWLPESVARQRKKRRRRSSVQKQGKKPGATCQVKTLPGSILIQLETMPCILTRHRACPEIKRSTGREWNWKEWISCSSEKFRRPKKTAGNQKKGRNLPGKRPGVWRISLSGINQTRQNGQNISYRHRYCGGKQEGKHA